MARYVMTARRRAALRKAQLASARKRRGRGKSRKRTVSKAVGVGVVSGAVVGASVYGFKNKSRIDFVTLTVRNVRKRQKFNRASPNSAEEKYADAVFRQDLRRGMRMSGRVTNEKIQKSKRADRLAKQRRRFIMVM